jgi:hypothetical protein
MFCEKSNLSQDPFKRKILRSSVHMMRFTAFPEIELNSGMRDIGDCWWAEPTYRVTITHSPTYPQGIYLQYLV